jgi:hypothetical protein
MKTTKNYDDARASCAVISRTLNLNTVNGKCRLSDKRVTQLCKRFERAQGIANLDWREI